MRTDKQAWTLFNHADVEILSVALISARRTGDQRRLSHSAWLARRKEDGRYLALLGEDQVVRRLPGRHGSVHLPAAADWLHPSTVSGIDSSRRLRRLLALIPALAATHQASKLQRHDEPRTLHHAGRDRFGRHLWLDQEVTRFWHGMRNAARLDGVALQAVSGYRSWNYQTDIIRRKLQRGLPLEAILKVNALPGFSEHHSGRAIDIAEPTTPPAETAFEATDAFAWLQRFGSDFGFRLSYPRDNALGITYEPWHWYWLGR